MERREGRGVGRANLLCIGLIGTECWWYSRMIILDDQARQ